MKRYIDYLPYAVMFTVVIINFIIFYALLTVMNVFEKEIIAAIIGFTGSIIGGLLTLMGVKWTLDSQKRKENQEKYEKANFVFTELLSKLIDVYNPVKSLSPMNWELNLAIILKNAKALERAASEMLTEARHIEIEFYRVVKSVQYYAGNMINYIDNIKTSGKTDKEIKDNLLSIYQGLAEADNTMLEIVRKIKCS
ncbi:hypothetical protein ACQKIC_16495 [Peribacillus sp. NPDC046944]|uniref:hypothetical protein n=1 Tax=unclassified Peribacillus TaxID=2675266 RepID=UPI003D09301B